MSRSHLGSVAVKVVVDRTMGSFEFVFGLFDGVGEHV